MKLLALIVLLFSTSIFASGAYHDDTRDGEGIFVIEEPTRTVFGFYTYFDNGIEILPQPSPSPPKPDDTICSNCPAWYIGSGGKLYLDLPLDYPYKDKNNELSETFHVGNYVLVKTDTGYVLDVKSTGLLPSGMYLFNHTFRFTDRLIGEH